MNSTINLSYPNSLFKENINKHEKYEFILKFSTKNERKILKAFLLGFFHKIFFELFQSKIKYIKNNSMECYEMDSKIIQLLIQGIIDTEEYTLEGIAFHTRIPFDILYDAACGISNEFSITPWARIVEIYMQVKPDIVEVLATKLLEIKDNNRGALSSLLLE